MPYPWERPQPRPADPFGAFNSRLTYYAPGPGDRMEGGFETSQPNPQTGRRVPSTLDNYRLGYSPFVTLAGDPSRYGQAVNMGPLTYTSPLDRKSYTLPDVTGVVHDTGSAFKGRPDKLDVAAGDYRGWSPQAASAAVQADGGRRTVTPVAMPQRPSGMDMEFDPWTGQAPSGGAVDSPAEGPTAVASGPPQQRQKTMANSLMDMFTPQDAAGQPTDLGGAVTSRSNSLIGLGLGLLSPSNPLRGQSSWGQGLEGFQAGAQLDARTAAAAAERRQRAAEAAMARSQHAADRAQAQSNFERQFERSDPAKQQTDYQRALRDLYPDGATPEQKAELAKQIWLPKTEGNLAAQAGQRQTIAKNLGMDPADPKTRAWIAGGGTLTDENKPPAGYEWGPADQTGRKTLVPIEGGPATKLSDAASAHLAMLQAAKPGLEEAKKYFLDPAPLLLREGGDQAGGSLYSAGKQAIGEATGSFEIGRQRRNVRLAVEAALRAATGAAAPDKEVDRYTDMYSPSIKDTYETRKQKIDALDRFISTYEGIATRGHGAPKQPAPAASGGVRKYNPETGKIE